MIKNELLVWGLVINILLCQRIAVMWQAAFLWQSKLFRILGIQIFKCCIMEITSPADKLNKGFNSAKAQSCISSEMSAKKSTNKVVVQHRIHDLFLILLGIAD